MGLVVVRLPMSGPGTCIAAHHWDSFVPEIGRLHRHFAGAVLVALRIGDGP